MFTATQPTNHAYYSKRACAHVVSEKTRAMERWRAEFHRLLQRPQALALGTRYFTHVSVLLFLLDAVATAGIIWRVPCEPLYIMGLFTTVHVIVYSS